MNQKASKSKISGPPPMGPIALPGDPNFMTSLARGLAVLECFAEQPQPLTITRASELTGLGRASVRRCLYTLCQLGFATQQGSAYVALPRVLRLGYTYLSSNAIISAAQPLLDQVASALDESCSFGVRDGDEVVYAARAEVRRIMAIGLQVGSRLPLYCTSMGRILLAYTTTAEQNAYLQRTPLVTRTAHTLVDPETLRATLQATRTQGYALVDQELELGLRSIAVPVLSPGGTLMGALNVGAQSARVSLDAMCTRYLPQLQQTALELGQHSPH